jgi:hypothetical protein
MSVQFGPLDLVSFRIVLVIMLNALRSEPTTLTSNQQRLGSMSDPMRLSFLRTYGQTPQSIRNASHPLAAI